MKDSVSVGAVSGSGSPIFESLRQMNIGEVVIKVFGNALRLSGKLSVDAFLENRSVFLKVGKSAIASLLLPHEAQRDLFNVTKNWYEYFYNKLIGRIFEEFDTNNISILTFNYERSLEHYLLTALKHSYGKTEKECAAKVQSIPIIHVYGSLGSLPGLGENPLEYGADTNPENLRQAAEGIKIINERPTSMEGFEQAQSLLNESEVICFLGFGYDETNLERLGLLPVSKPKEIYGSVVGLSKLERTGVESMLGSYGINLGGEDEDSLDILRNYPVFQ